MGVRLITDITGGGTLYMLHPSVQNTAVFFSATIPIMVDSGDLLYIYILIMIDTRQLLIWSLVHGYS